MNRNDEAVSREARREEMAQLLAKYPGLENDKLAELLHWFRKEASALDQGLIGSDDKLSVAYQALKKDHIDRLNGADLFWLVMLVGGAFLTVALIIWAA